MTIPRLRTSGAAPWLTAGAMLLALSACGKQEASPTSQVAARVNKTEISVHQINGLLQRSPPVKPEQSEAATRQLLERLIDQELAVEKAKALKLDRSPRVMQAIEAARSEIIARAYAEQLAGASPRPTPEEVQAYYDRKPMLFKERRVYSLQQLQVQAAPDQLPALRDKVQDAKSFRDITDYLKSARLPVRISQDTTPAESLPPPLLERFATLKPGQALFTAAPGGARIIVVAAVEPAPASLEQARPLIEQTLFNERRYQAVSDGLKALREASKIEYLGNFATRAASGTVQGPAQPEPPAAAEPPATGAAAAASAGAQPDTQLLNRGLGLK